MCSVRIVIVRVGVISRKQMVTAGKEQPRESRLSLLAEHHLEAVLLTWSCLGADRADSWYETASYN